MISDNSGPSYENAEKSRILAYTLFPDEEWIYREPGIWVARSRLRQAPKERAKLAGEMEHVRILARRESVAYFLPEMD
ncbi:MAG: hypothetical protein LBG22_06955, partial [Treponema sp.]|nr:hypothetical protein [Treponema sp.]